MDPASNLRASTTMYFDLINFAELNEDWIDEVIDNEFTDAEENNITVSILFVNDAVSTLTKLANICNDWNKLAEEDDDSQCSNISNQEILWTLLDEMEINVKQILGFIYLLCFKAAKTTSLHDEKKLGLCSARLYFNALRVPGSGAYGVFHPNLFKLCIDCLPAPDFTTDKCCMSMKDFDKLISVYIPTLISVISLLRDFYLGDDSNTTEHVIKKTAEICACEIQNSIKFDVDYTNLSDRELMRYKSTFIVSALAYQSFLTLLDTNLNGDQDQNYVTILSYLNKHILCLKAKRSQTISHKLQVIKDNAISFICHNLATKEFTSEVTQIALKRLCLGVNDKAEFRNTVSVAVVNILYKLKIEHVVLMIQWLLRLIDSVDTKDRVFALEVLGLLLNKPFQINDVDLSDSLKVYLTEVPVIFAILTRCDDTSPVVRTRALTVVSQNMKCILQFLYKTKDQETFEIEVSEEIKEQDMDVNGNHRFFWYNLTSLRERLNEIASILQRRIEDNNVTARKAALVALENLMVFDRTYLNAENLKYFTFAVKDANIVVRKQMIQSLSVVLDTYYNHPEIQACWLKCILPLVQDPETTVQGKAVSELEEQFLHRIFIASENDQVCAFSLLKLLASGDFLSHQRYFQKVFNIWKAEKKLKSQDILQLEKYLDSEWEGSILFFLSNFAAYCSLPARTSQLCMEQFEKYETSKTFPDYMDYLLKVLIHVSKNVSDDKLIVVKNVITNSLRSFDVPVQLISMYIELLLKIHKHLKTEAEFAAISSELTEQCEKQFSAIKASNSFHGYPEELLAKYICLIKELCQIDSSKISNNLVFSLKIFSGCDNPPTTLSGTITPNLRAHAFAALGKICLQDEILAKKLLDIYATELLSSKHDVIRNNLVIILIEMCKRYTSFADKYVPLISLCFKDQLYVIRYQTIVMLVNLLQEGYIKWRGPLFFCLLSTLNDKKDDIQELGRYSLSQLLQDKKKSLFSEHFIDSIFVFSGFPPPDNETLSQIVKDLDRFALKGENRREQRLHLYKFLLESMDMKERAYLVKSVCEILMNVAEAVYPLNEITEGIIRDCFAILTCKEIRALNVEQFSDDIDDTEEKDFIKTELETRRIVIVEPVIPVIVSLRNSFTDPSSDLMQDIILFLKELFHDFKDIMKDILSIDRLLLRQLELEIRNDAERERNEKRLEKDARHKNKTCSSNNQARVEREDSINLQGIQMMMNDVMVGRDNNEKGEKCNGNDLATSEQTLNALANVSKSTRNQSIDTSSGSSTGSSTIKSYNIVSSTPAEARDIRLFASTPRVMLTAVKLPQTSAVLNLSAIESNEPMEFEVSDENTI